MQTRQEPARVKPLLGFHSNIRLPALPDNIIPGTMWMAVANTSLLWYGNNNGYIRFYRHTPGVSTRLIRAKKLDRLFLQALQPSLVFVGKAWVEHFWSLQWNDTTTILIKTLFLMPLLITLINVTLHICSLFTVISKVIYK